MSISEIMNKCFTECTEDTALEQVYERIKKCDHGLVVVVDSEAHRVPIGVVSERSICEQLILRGKNPRSVMAGAVMDSRIKTVREMDPIDAAIPQDKDSITAVVVTNDKREVCGIIPREKLPSAVDAAATHSQGRVFINTNVRRSPASSEIPAFGWIQ